MVGDCLVKIHQEKDRVSERIISYYLVQVIFSLIITAFILYFTCCLVVNRVPLLF